MSSWSKTAADTAGEATDKITKEAGKATDKVTKEAAKAKSAAANATDQVESPLSGSET